MGPERLRGSVTLVALCLTTAIGIALASYVALCTRSTQLSTRLLHQEKARELVQIGLEEALWALNQNNWGASGPSGNTAWTTSGANKTVTLSYPMTGQGATGSVALTVANYASAGPTWPTVTATATLTLPDGQTATKSLQAATAPAPLFGNALASTDSYVSFTAGGTVDSYNSDPDNNAATAAVAYSFTAGNAANYDAVIAGNTNGSYGVILTQATLRGYATTFGQPVSYSTSGSPPGKILGPSSGAVNVDTTRIGKSAFVPLENVFAVTTPTVDGGTPSLAGLLIGLLNALLGGLGIELFKAPTGWTVSDAVTINHPTKIVVNGDFNLTTGGLPPLFTTTGKITIQAGGSLELYVSGDVTIGAGGFDNQTNDPKKLAIFCTGSSTTDAVEYNSASAFCGVIFSEHKPIDLRQNGPYLGAMLSRQYVRFSGSATAPNFHYDTALRTARFSAVSTPYVLKQVAEP